MNVRKKPVEVEAHCFLADGSNRDRLATMFPNVSVHFETGKLMISTMEGLMFAEPGDWIIVGIKGEVYPCKPDIFEKTYEIIGGPDK